MKEYEEKRRSEITEIKLEPKLESRSKVTKKLENGLNSKMELLDLDFKADEDDAEILDHWDPMKTHYNSWRNLPSLKPDNVEGYFTGRNSSDQNLCPFYDGISDGCFKGIHCKQLHIKLAGPRIAEQCPKLGVRTDTERVPSAMYLDPRKVAPPGSTFKAVVSCAECPSNFFLIPQYEAMCACTGVHSEAIQQERNTKNGSYTGIKTYNSFVKELNKTIGRINFVKKFKNEYEVHELVAFDVNSLNTKDDTNIDNEISRTKPPFWVRGVICEPVFLEEGYEKCPPVTVFLFDSGHTISSCTSRMMCQLPHNFSRLAPFAFRCSLYGIRPKNNNKDEVRYSGSDKSSRKMTRRWSTKAIKDFRKLVQVESPMELEPRENGFLEIVQEVDAKNSDLNLVVIEVKRSTCTDSDGVFQTKPYVVMITCKDRESGRVINVSEEMVRLGHAEFINFHPYSGFPFTAWEFLKPLSSLP